MEEHIGSKQHMIFKISSMFKALTFESGFNFNRIKPVLLCAMFITTFTSSEVYSDNVPEYKIKAGFIYNFARFTQWPDKGGDLNICIYGKDPFGHHIDYLDSKKVSSKIISIQRTNIIDNLKKCHIVFLNIIPPDERQLRQVINTIKDSSILTMSDTENAIDYGVMVGLGIKNSKVTFDINYSALLYSDLKINPQLIKLAKKVI